MYTNTGNKIAYELILITNRNPDGYFKLGIFMSFVDPRKKFTINHYDGYQGIYLEYTSERKSIM